MSEKRIISIVTEEPKELEGDTIYIKLTNTKEGVHAWASSAEPFDYFEYGMVSPYECEVKGASNHNGFSFRMSPRKFVEEICEMNTKGDYQIIGQELLD